MSPTPRPIHPSKPRPRHHEIHLIEATTPPHPTDPIQIEHRVEIADAELYAAARIVQLEPLLSSDQRTRLATWLQHRWGS